MESFNLDKSINHTIVTASILLRRQIYAIFKENDVEITPEQWVVLYYLWLKDGLSLGEIAKKTQKDNANITRIVNRLEKQGLIYKKIKNKDKRFYFIFLTEKSMKIKPKVFASIYSSTEICSKGLSKEEQNTFLNILNKIIENMNEYMNGG